MSTPLCQAQEEGEDPSILVTKSSLKSSIKGRVRGLLHPPLPLRLSKSAYFTFDNSETLSANSNSSTVHVASSSANIPNNCFHQTSISVDDLRTFQKRETEEERSDQKLLQQQKAKVPPLQACLTRWRQYIRQRLGGLFPPIDNPNNVEYINLEPNRGQFQKLHRLKRRSKTLQANPGICVCMVTTVIMVGLVYGVWKVGRTLYYRHRHGVYVECGFVHGVYEERVHVFKVRGSVFTGYSGYILKTK